jgi:hypothetical protein
MDCQRCGGFIESTVALQPTCLIQSLRCVQCGWQSTRQMPTPSTQQRPSTPHAVPHTPVVDPRNKRLEYGDFQYRKDRKGKGTISTRICIDGQWHDIFFGMDEAGLNNLSMLPERLRRAIFSTLLANVNIQTNRPKPRGRNTGYQRRAAWATARWLLPPFSKWIDECGPCNATYIKIIARMKSDGITDLTSDGVAAYLIERNICNAYRTWPGPGVQPTVDSRKFRRTVQRNTNPPALPGSVYTHGSRVQALMRDYRTAGNLPQDEVEEACAAILDGECILIVSGLVLTSVAFYG